MINQLRYSLKSALVMALAIVAALIMSVSFASAQGDLGDTSNIQESLDQGTCLSLSGCDAPEASAESVDSTVALAINILSWIVGVVSVIFIIFGGFKYITSGGDSSKVTEAKNTILYALIGLIIVALAQVIVRFVLGAATGGV